ncbi:MAG: hypothetical protein RhofKO_33390 [Rhodothermales bacterium]
MLRLAYFCCLVLIISCASTRQDSNRPACDLVGAWEPVELTLTAPDGTVNDVDLGDPPGLKVFSNTRWVWIETGPNASNSTVGAGGRYATTDSTYTESIEYHMSPDLVGQTLTFECEVTPTTWTQRGMLPGGTYLEETYRRIE